MTFSLIFQVDIFMDVAFDAVHVDIRFLSAKLLALNNDVLTDKALAEKIVKHICYQCEASLQFILSLCQQKMFRDRILSNKVPIPNFLLLFDSSFFHKFGAFFL